ncbi:hypothetical protein ACFQFC_12210 [Amorphoplanes digitatis]|uniref:Uncharacterized protein n=1 Tax=Actinoplanes digitatis TaxID=1868 RepID=A0A7W7I227_9ACTN|nr:hypothetical protein [Actinoplanes digitatis]MBB4764965.1 hypothetical protein [Actinoplanes digitatis]BFE74622.1 hypothetical protein GCM10020092_079230 [Actinoplanes digitatis]GID93941.1 hypothetical protein Adi01nite_33530 [Actinoplanes digitatis]
MALDQAPADGLTIPASHPRALARLTRPSARTSVRSRASAQISARTDERTDVGSGRKRMWQAASGGQPKEQAVARSGTGSVA